MTLKKVILIVVNLILMSLLYGVLINQTKIAIQNAKLKAGAYISQAHPLSDDIMRGLPILTIIYLLWAVLRRFVLKKQSIMLASLSMGILTYALFSFLFAFGAGNGSFYWVAMLPFFVIGTLLPLTKYWFLVWFNKKPVSKNLMKWPQHSL